MKHNHLVDNALEHVRLGRSDATDAEIQQAIGRRFESASRYQFSLCSAALVESPARRLAGAARGPFDCFGAGPGRYP